MIGRQILTTKNIESMSLDEFMKFKSDHYKSICLQTLSESNDEWLWIDMMENIKSMKELREKTRQSKEDLWWKIQSKKKARERQSKSDRLWNFLERNREEHLHECIEPIYLDKKEANRRQHEAIDFLMQNLRGLWWESCPRSFKTKFIRTLRRHLVMLYGEELSKHENLRNIRGSWEWFYEKTLEDYAGKTTLHLDVKFLDTEIRSLHLKAIGKSED